MRVERRKREASKTVGMRRHGCAREVAFRCSRNRHVLMHLLKKKLFVMLQSLQHLSGSHVLFLSSPLVVVDVASILVLDIGTLCSQGCAFLLSTLFGGKAFGVGGHETVVLLVESGLTLLKTLPLLVGRIDIRLDALHLALNLLLGLFKLASNRILVVALLFPLGLLGCSLFRFVFGDISQVLCLKGEICSSIVGLADILCELEYALALALITATSIG